MVGPWQICAPLMLGGSLVLYNGGPTSPDALELLRVARATDVSQFALAQKRAAPHIGPAFQASSPKPFKGGLRVALSFFRMQGVCGRPTVGPGGLSQSD